MDKLRKKKIKRLIALGCAAAAVLLLAAMPLLAKDKENADGPQASILSGTAQMGTVDSKLIGGGTLAGEDAVNITVPGEVKLKKFLVNNGDTVKAGDALASVDRVTVMTAITQVQETLDYLAEEILSEGKKSSDGEVTALAGGTVKVVYAQKGDSVQQVMLEHGSLAVLSLDGLMAVDMAVTSDLSAGDQVNVTLSNGKTVSGEVETNLSGNMTVTVTDKDYPIGEAVQVSGKDGAVIGSGALYVYSPWNATAYAGTVSGVKVKTGDTVSEGKTLLKLTDTGYTATYQQLLVKRQEYEDLMLELFGMYQTEQLTAPCDGVVTGIDQDSAQLLAAEGTAYSLDLLANAPNGDDTVAYTNFVGKVVAMADNGWAVQINPQALPITDYKVLTGVDLDEKKMTNLVIFNPYTQGGQIPMYELMNNGWVQGDNRSVAVGDIMLFAGTDENNMVWTVRVQKAAQDIPQTPETPNSGQTGETPQPGGATETPNTQTGGADRPQGGMPSGDWGNMGSIPQGGMTEEPEFESYDLTTAQVMTVTPQSEMTLEITVDELDINAVKLGMTAQVKINALGGEKFTATITDMGNTGTGNGGNSKFTVLLTMDRAENMLAGMNATASILLDSSSKMVTIPVEALAEEGNKTVVYTGYDEKKEMLTDPVTVKTGMSDGKTVEILEGISEGTVYYYAYYDTLEISAAPDFGGGMMFGR